MASSQVEIAPSSPFGCVLRDRNRRDGCNRESGSNWRKFLVKDHNLHTTCISIPPDSSASNENENSCWLPNHLRFSADNHGKSTNSNFKEKNNFPSRKSKEMPTTKTETLPPPLPRLDSLGPESPNIGAASLVRIWEKRLNRSKNGNNSNSTVSADWELSGNENNSSSSSPSSSPRESEPEAEDSVCEERFDSSGDWHSDRTAPSEMPSPCRSQNSDAGENERVRVADIIKRLTAANQGQSTLSCSSSCGNDNGREQSNSPRDCLSPVSDHTEQRIFSPRIRGRRAFADLLMQMERERQGELNALVERRVVSRFPQKGRIQSMLRLRLLQRGTAVQDRQQQRFAAASQMERLPLGSTITHLRERFSIGFEHSATSQSDATTNPGSPGRETNSTNLENSSIPNKPGRNIQNPKVNFIEQQDRTTQVQDPPAHIIHEELGPLTTVQDTTISTQDPLAHNIKDTGPSTPVQDTITQVQDAAAHNIAYVHEESGPLIPIQDASSPSQDPTMHIIEDIHQEPSPLSAEQDTTTPIQDLCSHSIEDTREEPCPSSSITWRDMGFDYRNLDVQETCSEDRNLASQETAGNEEASTSCGVWDGNDGAEELEENYQEHAEINYDWISDISRPRSYWEHRRQEWYREMLNSNSDNAEIRRLLERGTVSSFLASDFREKMDRLMATRLEIRQAHPVGGSQGEEVEGQNQFLSFLQNRQRQQQQQRHEIGEEEIEGVEQEQEQGEGEEEEEEEESLTSGQYHEAGNYFDQSTSSLMQFPSPTLLRSWSFRDDEVGDDSNLATSTSPSQNFPSQPYYHTARQCTSSRNYPSIEMEMICELRGQMEQFYQEISEIRKSLKSCMDMQMILMQQSMKQDLHSVEGEKKSFGRAVPKKGNCCICYEMKVDSLLYRCGHMCTCLKCAHELQWNSGKCPMCRAPIADVVRVYLELDS